VASVSVELAVGPRSLLEHDHPSPLHALLEPMRAGSYPGLRSRLTPASRGK
jgi:hypothetical protein